MAGGRQGPRLPAAHRGLDGLPQGRPHDARTAEEILGDAVGHWADGESPLAVLLG
ncbi:hypothetical protein ACFQ2B_25195 [Streptomyces stramineus]